VGTTRLEADFVVAELNSCPLKKIHNHGCNQFSSDHLMKGTLMLSKSLVIWTILKLGVLGFHDSSLDVTLSSGDMLMQGRCTWAKESE